MASLPVPDGIDLSESRVASIIGALSCTWALAAIAVALRFLARRIQSNKLWLEDWLITVSLTAAAVHVFISIGYIKWSTLALYWRIFNARKSIRYYIWAMAGIVLAWFIAVILVTIFQCLPVHAFWARYDTVNPLSSDQYTCGVDVKMFFKGNSIPNIITDALVVLLPIPYVWKLQLHKAQKFALAGIFALGTFVTVVSMARLNVILSVDLTSPDITWNFIDTIIWTNVEANTAIICACLPCLKPILNLALNGRLKSSIRRSGQNSGGQYILNDRTKPSTTNGSSYLGGSGTGAMRKGVGGGGAEDERPFTRLSERDSEPSIDIANDDGGSGHGSLSKAGVTINTQEGRVGEAAAVEATPEVPPTTENAGNATQPIAPVSPAAVASSPAAPVSPAAAIVAEEDPDPSTDGYETGSDGSSNASTSLSSSVRDYEWENKRRYHKFKQGRYLCPNDEPEQDREDMKHALVVHICDGDLHMGDNYPEADIDGIDLSPIQPGFVPPNVRFLVDDAEADWLYPDNSVDLIHLRHMAPFIKDWPRLLRQAYRVLKPGGWIELQELRWRFACDDDTMGPDYTPTKMANLIEEGLGKFGFELYASETNPERLRAGGFVKQVHDVKKVPLGRWPKDDNLKTIGLYSQAVLFDGLQAITMGPLTRGLGWTPEEVEVLLMQVRKDLRNAAFHTYVYYHALSGQKPVEGA
ncbi:TAM domain methyltransferase [Colletotrichum costaricense]|uniref:TAM domain methyltransferase n=1 Tax=Colletotrichum costaricense TaxID=1209916 RepID=A0AAJ0DV58_9PEZI|nr:TAM domain methyltransferase [Colletotrichum costaricense]KAK1514577.1 TAM domain methyltransferase [Colletotrichum costaricense]